MGGRVGGLEALTAAWLVSFHTVCPNHLPHCFGCKVTSSISSRFLPPPASNVRKASSLHRSEAASAPPAAAHRCAETPVQCCPDRSADLRSRKRLESGRRAGVGRPLAHPLVVSHQLEGPNLSRSPPPPRPSPLPPPPPLTHPPPLAHRAAEKEGDNGPFSHYTILEHQCAQ